MMEMQMKMKITKKDLCCFNPNPKPGSVVRIKFGWRPIWRLDRDRSFFNATASSHLILLAHNSYNPLTTVLSHSDSLRFYNQLLRLCVSQLCQWTAGGWPLTPRHISSPACPPPWLPDNCKIWLTHATNSPVGYCQSTINYMPTGFRSVGSMCKYMWGRNQRIVRLATTMEQSAIAIARNQANKEAKRTAMSVF